MNVTFKKRTRLGVAKLATVSLSLSLLAGLGLVPNASASTPVAAKQATLKVTYSNLKPQAGSSVSATVSGGSGTGAVTFAVTGTGCTLNSSTGALTAAAAATCKVVATKAASGNYLAISSSAVSVAFQVLKQATLKISNTTLSTTVGSIVTVTTTGGSGAGGVTFVIPTGGTCQINTENGNLTNSAAGTCVVTATKAASTGYLVAVSAPVKFTFVTGPMKISNTSLNGTVGSPTQVSVTAGQGSGGVTYAVTGTGCAISATGALTDTAAGTCVVTATKAANGSSAKQTNTATFTFAPGSDNPTYASPDSASLVSMTGVDNGTGLNDSVFALANFLQQFYEPSDRFYETYVTAGAPVTMKWHVTGVNGAPLVGQAVTLTDNLSYSNSQGTSWSVSGLNANPNSSGNNFNGGTMSGTTDSNGDVTFTFTDTNTATGSNPTDMTTTGGAESNEATYPWSRFVLQVGGDIFTAPGSTPTVSGANQVTDLVDVIVVPSGSGSTWTVPAGGAANGGGTGGGSGSGAVPIVASANLTAATGLTTGTGFIDNTVTADGWFILQYYGAADKAYSGFIPASGTATLSWHVTDANGAALANQAVTLEDNIAYGGGCGTSWQETGLNVNPNTGATCNAAGGANGHLSGTTDANGNVTFTIHNTNTSATSGVCPTAAQMTAAAVAGQGTFVNANEGIYKWTRFLLQVGTDTFTAAGASTTVSGANQVTDMADVLIIPSNCSAGSAAGTWTAPAGGTSTGTGTGTGTGTSSSATFAAPDVAALTSVTGLVANTNLIDDTVNGNAEFLNQYYESTTLAPGNSFPLGGSQDKWLQGFINAGATVTLNWTVTDSKGSPLANKAVTLDSNLPYGCEGGVTWATASLNSNNSLATSCNGGTQGTLAGTTDATGKISFTLVNTNVLAKDGANTCPTNMSTLPTSKDVDPVKGDEQSVAPAKAGTYDAGKYAWTRFALQVSGDSYSGTGTENQATTLLDLIVIPTGC